MEIQKINKALGAYRTTKSAKIAPKGDATPPKKTDTIMFDHAGQMETAKADIASGVRESASAERIETLKSMIDQGEYYVASEKLAQIISGLGTDI